MEDKDFIGKIWKQNCGDDLKVLRSTENRQCKARLYLCKFIKYPYEILALKQSILRGLVTNPQIEMEEFAKKIWPQNCGDSLRIIRKTNKKRGTDILWEAEFIKYPYKILKPKAQIKQGQILNPQIEQIEFIDKLWPQNCGDIIKVIKKIDGKKWEIKFIKYPYNTVASKDSIIKGQVNNPQIEIEEFVNKLWPQRCGDTLKVLEKTNKHLGKDLLWKCQFIKYPYIIYKRKGDIICGDVTNPNSPYYSDGSSVGETEMRKFCISLDNSFLETSTWCELDGKEIDIYSPKLKLGIEFNGDYWHSDELCYKIYGISSKERDLRKYNIAKEKGIDIYFIKEWDWTHRQEVVKRYLKMLINKYKNININ